MSSAATRLKYRARKLADGFADLAHGTQGTYSTGCRCSPCTEANRERQVDYALRKQADGFAGLKHGSSGTYGLGCRCDLCRSANTERARRIAAKRRTS